MRRRILVTGGAGFLGSHLCRSLAASGDSVIALDDFSTGSPRNLQDCAGIKLLKQDVRAPLDLDVDYIYHLACPASPKHYQQDAVRTLLTNVQGTYSMLRLAERCGARFLQASTSEIYGDPQQHPQREPYRGNTSTTGPRACYDEGKRAAEALVMDFHRQHGVDVRLVRIFNTYGPQMAIDDGRVISNFIVQALTRKPLTIYGDGTQTRSLCYVSDMIAGLRGAMEQTQSVGPFNLGNPVERSVREIADEVLAQVGGGSIVYEALPEDDPVRRQPDISRAQRTFGFQPTVSLREGLRATISDFTERLGLREDPRAKHRLAV